MHSDKHRCQYSGRNCRSLLPLTNAARWGLLLGTLILLAGCASHQARYATHSDSYPTDRRDLSQVPDAVPRAEPRARFGNASPYTVLGRQYRVLSSAQGFVEEGQASFYGTKFHGYATSSGEPYDMYAMTAAHKNLPLPSYARVTNLDNGRTVVVRVNDRGPFHDGRVIDLSYAAAWRLGILDKGTGHVRIEGIDPAQEGERRVAAPALPQADGQGDSQEDANGSAQDDAQDDPVAVVPSAPRVAASVDAVKGSKMLQVMALSSAQHAEQLSSQLSAKLSLPVIVQREHNLYRIHVGPFSDEAALASARVALNKAGYAHPIEVNATP